MVDKLIIKLQKQGKLKKQKSGIVQVEALLRESEKAFQDAIFLIKRILTEVKAINPQLELKFNLE